MVDESTTNKNYPLPHPSNIESQDVERIATAISMIDEDVQSCFNSVANASSIAESWANKTLKIPTELVGQVDTELQNLQPGQYIVVNDDATGFTTVEGGGGEGGKKGEILVKKSDANFDTTWIDPRAVLKKAPTIKETTSDIQLQNNSTVILSDTQELEVADDTPRHGLTQRQINSDVTADSSYTYVVCDTIDDTAEDESDIATSEKFGRVKIGSGINVNDGVISVPTIGLASEDNFGIVRVGSGLNVQDGVVSTQPYSHADSETFGLVKPGSDFYFDANGALNVVKSGEDIIYQKAKVNVVDDSVIRIVPTCAHYRAFINTDTLFSFEFGDFVPKDDISFDLEICSDGEYIIRFDYDIIWEIGCAGVTEGTTIIHFEKLLGENAFRASLVSTPPGSIRRLTPSIANDITEYYICGHNGSSLRACTFITNTDVWTYSTFSNPSDPIWYIDFFKSTYVDYLQYSTGYYGRYPEYCWIEGSVDRIHWVRLLSLAGNMSTKNELNIKGFFKHYRIRCKGGEHTLFNLYGYDIEDEKYELAKLIPAMSSNSSDGYVITSSGLTSGNLYNVTTDNTSTWANFETRLDGQFWVKYELPEAKSVDMIDLGARHGSECNRMPTWFKIEGSNDDENWDLIIERASPTQWYQGETHQYWIYNQTPYKFYRLLSIEQPTAYFSLSRFRLYKKIEGTVLLEEFVPTLSSNFQGGYEVSASSQYDGNHVAFHAFDGSTSTVWATTDNTGVGGWIQIKFPAETLCTALRMTSRNDQWYIQAPSEFTILGSIDGANFETLKTVTGQTWAQGKEEKFTFVNETPYLYYRIQAQAFQNNNSGAFGLALLNFGSDEREYKRYLERWEYLVPVMSSNSQNGYVATSSSLWPNNTQNYQPYKAFNKDTNTFWAAANNTDIQWLKIELPTAAVCNTVQMSSRSESQYIYQAPRNFEIQGSNDDDTWITLTSQTDIIFSAGQTKTFEFENNTSYKYYRLYITVGQGTGQYNNISVSVFNLMYHTITREY